MFLGGLSWAADGLAAAAGFVVSTPSPDAAEISFVAAWAANAIRQVRGSVFRVQGTVDVTWTPPELLEHIARTCGASLEPKELGASAASSKSGASFWNCATPEDGSEYGRVLIKGGIKDTIGCPEWTAFSGMADRLSEHYSHPTLLNKLLMGFDLVEIQKNTQYDAANWLVLEDVKAQRLMSRLPQGLVQGDPAWAAFDVKPAGSRAPELAPCLQKLQEVASAIGPIKDFVGWDRMQEVLASDLAFLKQQDVMDESLFVQVAGPFPAHAGAAASETIEAALAGGTPWCVHRLDAQKGLMAIVCVSVLDYTLSMTHAKQLQNEFQGSRWNDYEQKMQLMMTCFGDLADAACGAYERILALAWQKAVEQQYQEMDESRRAALDLVESAFKCCCYVEQTKGLTVDSPCVWVPKASLPSTGGCQRVENETVAEGSFVAELPDERGTGGFGSSVASSQHIPASAGGCVNAQPPL